jgi:hypothetical protein
MRGIRGLNRVSNSQSVLSRKHSHSPIAEIESCIPGEIHTISSRGGTVVSSVSLKAM